MSKETKAEMTKEEFANCVVNLRTSACFMTDGDAKGLHDEVSEPRFTSEADCL